MRRLLQRIEDGRYYQGRGTWTEDPEHALAFNKTSGAIECCLRERLPPVQLVLKFEDSVFDIRLPCSVSDDETPPPRAARRRRNPQGPAAVS